MLTCRFSEVVVTPERKEAVAKAIGSWSFSAHSYSDDELLYGALLMLQHALKLPELERWRMSSGKHFPPPPPPHHPTLSFLCDVIGIRVLTKNHFLVLSN